jgi:hypothetical protein
MAEAAPMALDALRMKLARQAGKKNGSASVAASSRTSLLAALRCKRIAPVSSRNFRSSGSFSIASLPEKNAELPGSRFNRPRERGLYPKARSRR